MMWQNKPAQFIFKESGLFHWAQRYSSACMNGYSLLDSKELHEPGENFKAKDYVVTKNTENLLKAHLEQTKGQVRTRFPPEPSGVLHLGHARAINISFGYASLKKGVCFLRYDDTNPETVEHSVVSSIEDSIKWLGFEPNQIRYTSDYFPVLYKYAQDLIKKGLAYVCHQSVEELNAPEPIPSQWAHRPIDESLDLFKKMNEGHFDEGQAILRLKHQPEHGNTHPVAYRIKMHPHPRTGTRWKVYPTYDFAHSLSDSMENITHSLCTAEFEKRRPTYYWICNAVGVYCPVQIEFGRLHLQYSITSKRKIRHLIQNGHIRGWDDPRLSTLAGLKRRGFPPQIINNVCQEVGWKRESVFLDPKHMEELTRDYLIQVVPRVMAVKNPLRVKILNFPYDSPQTIEAKEKTGTRVVTFDREIYLNAQDFHEKGGSEYRRLTPTQSLGLKHVPFAIKFHRVIRKDCGSIDHIEVTCHLKKDLGRQKAYVQWVSRPLRCQSREFGYLLKCPVPVSENLSDDLNEDSWKTYDTYVDQEMAREPIGSCFQFDRLGYYRVDEDSTKDEMVFNRIVPVKGSQITGL